MHNHACIFYIILFIEALFWPFLWIYHQIKIRLTSHCAKQAYRLPVDDSRVIVGVHEWGGYESVRSKMIKHGVKFKCGLKYQLQRFTRLPNVELIVTMSDAHLCKSLDAFSSVVKVIEVDNSGFDFSGYNAIYQYAKTGPNRYIILTNSSVSSDVTEFLGGYIDYMNRNPNVGMLGVSYCTQKIQSLIRPNFTPHLQSFFLLTTTQVLSEVVALNNGKFPGVGITHKLLLIRKGEIRLSNLVMQLGYRLAVINPIDSVAYKFDSFNQWNLPFGDIRQKTKFPNRITPIINDNSIDSNI